MLSFRQKFIGIQLIIIFQYTTALVLLTANFEDVKKIARKFFSEPIAEQIATFIAKANDLAPDVSEENDENASNVQDISTNELETSKKQQSTSKRHKTWPRQTTEREEPAYVNQEPSESLKQMQKYQIKVTKKHDDKTKSIYRPNPKPEMEQTSRYSNKQKGTSNSKHSNSYWNKKPQQPPKQYIWEKLEPVKKFDYSEDSSEHQSPKPLKGKQYRSKSKYAGINQELGSMGQHKDDRKRKGPKADSVEIQFKHQPFQLRSHDDTLLSNDDEEHKESKKKPLEIEFTVVNANTNIRTRNRNELTTEKEKIDFDQYDIGKKHTLVIATSGPVELKRRNTGWREKEMSKATAEEERKPWL